MCHRCKQVPSLRAMHDMVRRGYNSHLTLALQVFHLFLAELLWPPRPGCPRAEAESAQTCSRSHQYVDELVWPWREREAGAWHESVCQSERARNCAVTWRWRAGGAAWPPSPVNRGQRREQAGLFVPGAAGVPPRCPAPASLGARWPVQPGHCRAGRAAVRPGSL